MIIGDGAGFDYLVDVLVNLDLGVIKFLRRFQYGLYVIIFTRYCLLKFMLLDLFYREKVMAVVATMKAVTTAATMAEIVVAAATVTATAVSKEDIGGDSNGGGHRQQSTLIGSKDMVVVATAMEAAAASIATTATCRGHANDCPGHWRRRNRFCHHLGCGCSL
jgi:hypothetical protein